MDSASLAYNQLLSAMPLSKPNYSSPDTLSIRRHQFGKCKKNAGVNVFINKLFRRIKGIKTPDIFTLFHAVEYDCNKEIFAFFFHNTTSSSLYINRPCLFIFNPSPLILFVSNIIIGLKNITHKLILLLNFYSDEIPAWNGVKVPVDEYSKPINFSLII
jgi:hypothetical protein